ncbi:hypothetical protein EDC01DRAFT_629260 [Geopyxis carbonaria]|nr:hypothetical protein EDC01DRAFT_629260 [Geopyxis carbonaria]
MSITNSPAAVCANLHLNETSEAMTTVFAPPVVPAVSCVVPSRISTRTSARIAARRASAIAGAAVGGAAPPATTTHLPPGAARLPAAPRIKAPRAAAPKVTKSTKSKGKRAATIAARRQLKKTATAATKATSTKPATTSGPVGKNMAKTIKKRACAAVTVTADASRPKRGLKPVVRYGVHVG